MDEFRLFFGTVNGRCELVEDPRGIEVLKRDAAEYLPASLLAQNVSFLVQRLGSPCLHEIIIPQRVSWNIVCNGLFMSFNAVR